MNPLLLDALRSVHGANIPPALEVLANDRFERARKAHELPRVGCGAKRLAERIVALVVEEWKAGVRVVGGTQRQSG